MDGINYSCLAGPDEAGIDPAALARLHQLFDRQFAEDMHPAAQLVVLKEGRVIVDRAAGTFRNGKPVTADTPFYCFSVSKAFTGMCVHKLIGEKKVSLDAPVAEYWPGFGRRGKEEITIRQVFLHLAGLPAMKRYGQIPLWPFWRLTVADVAYMRPEYKPGSKMAYHPVSWGFILGEVVRRVSGMPFEVYFDRYFAQPLGMHNTWFRLPRKELSNSPEIVAGTDEQKMMVQVFGSPPIRRSVIPAASLHSPARQLAVFYHMIVHDGKYRGQELVSPAAVDQALSLGYKGWDEINKRETLWGFGFHLGGRSPENSTTPDHSVLGKGSTLSTFGHTGNRSSMAWGDREHKLAVAFTCNKFLSYQDTRRRWMEINDAVWDLIGEY